MFDVEPRLMYDTYVYVGMAKYEVQLESVDESGRKSESSLQDWRVGGGFE